MAVTSSGNYEAFILLVREDGQRAHTIRVDADQYADATVGAAINIDEQETYWQPNKK